eukprot:5099853-Pleurochrysis_carterae.AAC.2
MCATEDIRTTPEIPYCTSGPFKPGVRLKRSPRTLYLPRGCSSEHSSEIVQNASTPIVSSKTSGCDSPA